MKPKQNNVVEDLLDHRRPVSLKLMLAEQKETQKMEQHQTRIGCTKLLAGGGTKDPLWKEFAQKIFQQLAGQPSEAQWEALFAEMRSASPSDPKFEIYLAEAAIDHIEALIMSSRDYLYGLCEKTDGNILQVYCDRWLTFIKAMELLTETQEIFESPDLRRTLVNVCVDFWTMSFLNKKDSIVLPAMARIISQKIFVGKSDLKQLEQVYKIAKSFTTMHEGTQSKAFDALGETFNQIVIRDSLREHVIDSSLRNPCRDALSELSKWRESVLIEAHELHLTQEVKPCLEEEISSELAPLIYEDIAKELFVEVRRLVETGKFEEIVTLSDLAWQENLRDLWANYVFVKHGLPPVLAQTEKNILHLRKISEQALRFLPEMWKEAIFDNLEPWPMDSSAKLVPNRSVEGSRAYCDSYFTSWVSVCTTVFLYNAIMERFCHLYERSDCLTQPLNYWLSDDLIGGYENIYHNFTAVIREFFSNSESELDVKLIVIANSFRMRRCHLYNTFADYFTSHVAIPHGDEVASKLREKLTLENFAAEVERELNHVNSVYMQLLLPPWVFKQFEKRVMRSYYDIISAEVVTAITKQDVCAINNLCGLVDVDNTGENLVFLNQVYDLCLAIGQAEIESHSDEGHVTPSSLVLAIMEATPHFDRFVDSIKSETVRREVLEAFSSALHEEANSIHFPASKLMLEYFIFLLTQENAIPPHTNEDVARMRRAFRYLRDAIGLSEYYEDLFWSRTFDLMHFSGAFEEKLLELLGEFMPKKDTRLLEQRISDILLSQERMRNLPLEYGFERNYQRSLAEKPGTDKRRALETLQAFEESGLWGHPGLECHEKDDGEPNGALMFQGVEVDIRILRRNMWRISEPNTKFTPPSILRNVMNSFERIYKMGHNCPKLTWAHHVSRVEMQWKFTLDKRVYDVHCSSYIAAVMLTFEETNETTLEAIQKETSLTRKYLEAVVDSLLEKNILVRKENYNREALYLNSNFNRSDTELILDVLIEGKGEQSEKNRPEREHERKARLLTCTKAALIRIAKRASKITKHELVQKAIWEMGSLIPEPDMITSALKELLEHEYLEYDEGTGMFSYLP